MEYERILLLHNSIPAYLDIIEIIESKLNGKIKKINKGLSWIVREINVEGVPLLLIMSLTDPSYGIRISTTCTMFSQFMQKAQQRESIIEKIVEYLRDYWAQGKGRLNEEKNRPVMNTVLRTDGWTKCPYCNVNFATYSKTSWNEGIHLSCGTTLRLITK
ncbi:MAG: hypothetical protein AB1489_30765 [Acidobacteriota bacterium]